MHVVHNDFPIPTDGILGRDFLDKYCFKIDYENYIISTRLNENIVEVPLIVKESENNIYIPARCEVICAVNIVRKTDLIIEKQELEPGIFVGSGIIPSKGIAHARFLNVTDKNVTIRNFKPQTSEICCDQKSFSSKQNMVDRIKKLEKLLKIDGLDKDAKDVIFNICKQYNDLFFLEGDILSVNNFYTQNILTTEHAPVYTKNYRQSHNQKTEINSQISKLIENNIIEPSVSPYNSPILLVPKKKSRQFKTMEISGGL